MAIRSGCRTTGFDGRDFLYTEIDADFVSQSSFIINHDVPVVDQGQIVPCCVSIAVTTCLEIMDDDPSTPLSYMFNYYWARENVNQLSSLDIRKGLQSAAVHGVCKRSLHNVANDRIGAQTTPQQSALDDALTRKIAFDPVTSAWAYKRFSNFGMLKAWKDSLIRKSPIIMGFYITKGYEIMNNNIHQSPGNSVSKDGHAVTVLGFDDEHDNEGLSPGAFLIRDSRGSGFAANGYWWLPYQWVETHLVIDSWTVLRLT